MKGLLKKWLFGDVALKTFYSVRGNEGDIKETVFLKTATGEIDITHTHAVICLEPMKIGFFHPQNRTLDLTDKYWLEVRVGHTLCSKIEISFPESIDVGNSRLYTFNVMKANSYQLSKTKQNLLLHIFLKNKSTSNITERKQMAALYAYPRKVILVSVRDESYVNIFPMDLQCYLPGSHIQVLGLRTTNIALDKILQLKKVVITDTQDTETNVILELGKHHTHAPTEFSFNTIESAVFKFPVPETIGSYREIEILFHKNIGSHTLMIGKTVNTKMLQMPTDDLFHLHVFEYLGSDYRLD